MDPDANLEEMRRLVRVLVADGDSVPNSLMPVAQRLAELVEALDEWIVRGGFLPRAWRLKGDGE